MSSIRLFAIAACLALLGASAPPADSLEGNWRNTKNTVHLRVAPCGEALCGTVTWAAEQQRADAKKGSGKDLVGSALLRDLRPAGEGKWRGKIYIPDIDTTAAATVTRINDKQILVSGCTMLGIICRSQHWHRM